SCRGAQSRTPRRKWVSAWPTPRCCNTAPCSGRHRLTGTTSGDRARLAAIDDLLRGQCLTPLPTDHFEPFDLIPTDRTDPRPWPRTVPKPVPRLELRAATAPSKSSPSPADLTRPSAATRVTGLRISW